MGKSFNMRGLISVTLHVVEELYGKLVMVTVGVSEVPELDIELIFSVSTGDFIKEITNSLKGFVLGLIVMT